MQAFEAQQQSNAALITTIIQGWIADEAVVEDIVVDLRGHTLAGDHLNLEPPANSPKTLTMCNGTLEVADGIRVKALAGLTMENVVSLAMNESHTCPVLLLCLYWFSDTIAGLCVANRHMPT